MQGTFPWLTTKSSVELNDDELVQQMHDDLYDGLKEEIEEGTNICSVAAGCLMMF